MKIEKILQRTSYLRAIFGILPFGIGAVVLGLTDIRNRPTEDELISRTGIVEFIGEKKVVSDISKSRMNALVITVDDKDFYTIVKRHQKTLIENINEGDSVIFWHRPEGSQIVKARRSDALFIPYKRVGNLMIGLVVFGFMCIISSVLYIVTTPEDLWGGDKEKMRKFFKDIFDPWHTYRQ